MVDGYSLPIGIFLLDLRTTSKTVYAFHFSPMRLACSALDVITPKLFCDEYKLCNFQKLLTS
jgi:hypothetical protein